MKEAEAIQKIDANRRIIERMAELRESGTGQNPISDNFPKPTLDQIRKVRDILNESIRFDDPPPSKAKTTSEAAGASQFPPELNENEDGALKGREAE